MKPYLLVAALGSTLGLLFGAAVQAAAIDLAPGQADHPRPVAEVATNAQAGQAGLPSPSMSELPEPEVFAMMLVGLILIGYRASRDSSEKFRK